MSANKIYKRQLDLIRPSELMFPITVIGVGGIGSWTAFQLSKMGAYALTIIDNDTVEPHNIPSQLYAPQDIGKSKVDALQVIIRTFTDHTPIPFNGTVQEYAAQELPLGRVVISAVDSLEQRKQIWEIVKPLFGGIDLYIDARMGGEQLRLLCVSPYNADSMLKYDKKMEIQQPADPTPCTARSIVYNTSVIGGFIGSVVKRYAKKEPIEFDVMFDLSRLERN